MGDTHVCNSGDPERALYLAPAMVRDQASSFRNLGGDTPIYASTAMSAELNLSCGTYNGPGAWTQAYSAMIQG